MSTLTDKFRKNVKPEILKPWVEDLRSGKRAQVKGALCKVNPETGDTIGFCCLGILAEHAVEAGVVDKQVSTFYGEVKYDGIPGLPTQPVAEWSGFVADQDEIFDWVVPVDLALERKLREKGFAVPNEQERKGDYDGDRDFELWIWDALDDGHIGLATLNDSAKFTFAEIADEIERAYLQ